MMENITKKTATQSKKYFMLTSVLFVFLLLNNLFTIQSENSIISLHSPPPEKIKGEEQDVYVEVDEQPEFPGGYEAMREWFSNNMPSVLGGGHGVPGRILVTFIVEKDGSLSDISIKRGVDPSLDKAALKAVKLMPKWKPGVHKGDTVRVRYVTVANHRTHWETIDEPSEVEQSSDHVFEEVDEQPEFPGGEEAMREWFSDNMPPVLQGCGIHYRTIVSFIVEKDGSLSDIIIKRGVDPSIDKAALKAVELMPKWKPGVHKGDTVRVRYVTSVNYRIY